MMLEVHSSDMTLRQKLDASKPKLNLLRSHQQVFSNQVESSVEKTIRHASVDACIFMLLEKGQLLIKLGRPGQGLERVENDFK